MCPELLELEIETNVKVRPMGTEIFILVYKYEEPQLHSDKNGMHTVVCHIKQVLAGEETRYCIDRLPLLGVRGPPSPILPPPLSLTSPVQANAACN